MLAGVVVSSLARVDLEPRRTQIMLSSQDESLFRSSGYLEDGVIVDAGGERHPISDLPPFLRTLLVADGTVTKALEAYFWEPVDVRPLQQKLARDTEPKGPPFGQAHSLLHREVSLEGRRSGTRYALARSILALENLPPHFAEAIVAGKMGIGELLREQGVETYRDIIGLDYFPRGVVADERLEELDDDIVARSYRISVSGVPAILVTEYFPIGCYLP